jgi:hypothetical protein
MSKGTSISTDPFRPLEIEWTYHKYRFERQADDSFKQTPQHHVTLKLPALSNREEVRLVNMAPGTALNLLKWLQENEELITQLAQEET